MVRVITQETYDEVVKENMEEFDMPVEEAIKEAIAQFEAQGVNLSNIIKDVRIGDGESYLVTTTVTKLKDICGKEDCDIDELLKELDVLKEECNKDLARRVKAGKEGAYKVLIDLLHKKQFSNVITERDCKWIISVLNTLIALMDTQPDLLDQRGVDLIKNILNDVVNDEIVLATLKWTTTCCFKHERNRQVIFAKNIGFNLKNIINVSNNQKVLSASLQVIRKLTLDDDIRVEVSKAHEHAKELGAQMLEPLMNLLKENTKPPLVSDLMLTIASVLVRNELCKMAADCDVDVLFIVLADNYDNVNVIQQAMKLITALAGNDDVKRDLVKSGIVPIIITILSRHSNNPTASALTLKCIAALSLRERDHAIQCLENGAPEAILNCMKIHTDDLAVQRNACWAIRNLVSRCRNHNAKFHELGVQAVLDAAHDKYGDECGYDIRSALRDLECNVKLDEQWVNNTVHNKLEH